MTKITHVQKGRKRGGGEAPRWKRASIIDRGRNVAYVLNDDYSLYPTLSDFGAWQSDRDGVLRESDVVSGRMHLVEQCDVKEGVWAVAKGGGPAVVHSYEWYVRKRNTKCVSGCVCVCGHG